MEIKAIGTTEKAVLFTATWEAFKAKSEETKCREWQEAYFELMSIDNTYSVFYEMGIKDYRIEQGRYSVRFYLIAKEAFAKNIRDWLEDHFTEHALYGVEVALFETFDITDMKGKHVDEFIYGVYEG